MNFRIKFLQTNSSDFPDVKFPLKFKRKSFSKLLNFNLKELSLSHEICKTLLETFSIVYRVMFVFVWIRHCWDTRSLSRANLVDHRTTLNSFSETTPLRCQLNPRLSLPEETRVTLMVLVLSNSIGPNLIREKKLPSPPHPLSLTLSHKNRSKDLFREISNHLRQFQEMLLKRTL